MTTLSTMIGMIGFDSAYIFYVMIPGLILAAWAQMKVKSAYAHASKIAPRSGLTGADAAAMIMGRYGHEHVRIEQTQGWLSDHYDPRSKTLRLSPEVYSGRSLAALGIAAHEAGHALQDAEGYAPLVIRNAIVPMASFGSTASYIVIIVGFVLSSMSLIAIGVGLFSLMVIFQLVNLPCEFNASSRARIQLKEVGALSPDEEHEVKRVLDAAAMTYVAAVVTSVMTLIYYLWRMGLFGGRN